jgi:hypothetical protein
MIVLCLAGAAGGGYAAGASHGHHRSRVTTPAGRPAVRVYGAEWSIGVMRGLVAGKRSGEREGRVAGNRLGHDAGRAAARRATPTRAAVGKPETEGGSGHLSGGVLVVGDSLEVLTSPYLQHYLPGVRLTINVRGGYSSILIFGLFRQSYDPSQSVIVFDAGTNDNPSYPQILASRLRAVAGIVGHRCLVVPTIHGLSVNGVNSDAKNRVIQAFAAAVPGTQTPDWAGVVPAHPELMQPDHLHPNAVGAAYRARLIAAAVRRCLALQAAFPVP